MSSTCTDLDSQSEVARTAVHTFKVFSCVSYAATSTAGAARLDELSLSLAGMLATPVAAWSGACARAAPAAAARWTGNNTPQCSCQRIRCSCSTSTKASAPSRSCTTHLQHEDYADSNETVATCVESGADSNTASWQPFQRGSLW